ncbi:MAG: UxaA family hydrolase [Candidatus Zipacnadales bacterium]
MTVHAIVIHPNDDVAVVTKDVLQDETVTVQACSGMAKITANQDIPAGHKIALRDLAAGASVLKYGEKIGHALLHIRTGDHVHLHNLASDRVQATHSSTT